MTFYNWSAAHSVTNCCNCLRKRCHLSSQAWIGHRVDNYEVDFAWFQLQFIKEAGNSCSRRVGEWERGGVSGGQWSGDWGCFIWFFCVDSTSLKKFQTSCLSCLTLETEVQFMFTLICLWYFCNPPNYDMDYRIFNVPTWSFNTYVYTHVPFAFIC